MIRRIPLLLLLPCLLLSQTVHAVLTIEITQGADAGLPMAKAATLGKEAGLSGLEFGLAIPGTVGGAVWAILRCISSRI